MSGQGGSGYSGSSSSTSGLQAGGRTQYGDINTGGLGSRGVWIAVAVVTGLVVVAVIWIVRKP